MPGTRSGYKRFIENYFQIVDKKTQLVPFKLNEIQDKFLMEDASMERDVILKARKQGFSSLILAMFTKDFLLREFSRNVIVADTKENSEGLLDRVKLYIESYEEKKGIKIPMKYNTRYELYNEAMKSKYYVGTAQNVEFGRSKDITNLHFCVGENTKVILSDLKTKKIKDINIGDEVITRHGRRTKVTNKWETGVKPIKRIRLWLSNETIDVSPDHKVSVLNNNSYKWKKAKDLTTEDYVEWSYHHTLGNRQVMAIKRQKNCKHLAKGKHGLVLKADYKLGYFLGYYLAEGHISKNLNRISFACEKNEEFYKNFIDIFPIKPTIKVKKLSTGTRKEIVYNSRELAMFVEEYVGRVEDKRVPKQFLYDYSKNFLKGLYQGWKDGDGSKGRKDCCYLTTIQEQIARPMRQIGMIVSDKVLALDYREKRYRYDKQNKPVYVLREHRNGDNIGKRSLKYKKINGKFYIRIKSIEEVEEQKTYEIEVLNQSHCYLTPCGIISNSECAFFPDLNRLFAGAMQALTDDSYCVLETTANGWNHFRDFWFDCKAGKRNFKPTFYSRNFYPQEFLERKKAELKELFVQEYPENDAEAFLASGETYFAKDALDEYIKHIKEPIKTFKYGYYDFI